MRLRCIILSAVVIHCVFLAGLVPIRAGTPPVRRSVVVDVVEKVRPAVVNIHSERSVRGEDMFVTPAPSRANGMGTGIVIDPRGYLITNQHVVEDVSVIRIRLSDGSTHSARVIARDREHDLALLKIDVGRALPTLSFGTSSDLMVGETVIAIGNAYGYDHTVTAGVISALHRDVTLNKEISYKSLIQTDACINPGNSGGPLLNVEGKLVGVNVAIRAGAQGIGFAIPVDQMVGVVTGLLESRRRDTWTGMTCRNQVNTGDALLRSLEVQKVDPDGPAAKAGLHNGDVLLRAGDVDISSSIDLERALLGLKAGAEVPIKVRRGSEEQQLKLTLESIPENSSSAAALTWRQLGVKLSPATLDVVNRGSSFRINGGMLVTEVNPSSPAGRAGILQGDILIGLHEWETASMDNVAYVLGHPKLQSFTPLRFFIRRGGQDRQGVLQLSGRMED